MIRSFKAHLGHASKLGATPDDKGCNFAIYTPHSLKVMLCFFDQENTQEIEQWELLGRTHGIAHGYIEGVRPGALYGYRIAGPFHPNAGHWYNANKLLIDPYCHGLSGHVLGHPSLMIASDLKTPNEQDSAPYVPKSRVFSAREHHFDWQRSQAPRTPWSDTIIYEAHVKGFTAQMSEIPESLRGTYLGMAHPAALNHLRRLGITTLELLPIQYRVSERALDAKGLTNYWGYNPIAYFCPDIRFASKPDPLTAMIEFKTMVRAIHTVGIEVLLDVVYNHTAESAPLVGPTLSFRGIDNHVYYRLQESNAGQYVDFSGCGNSLDTRHPMVLRLVTDSLRYWVETYGVDGFRFDLASTLGRDGIGNAFDPRASLLDAIAQDPILRECKLIAEPWDLGHGGYQVGNFPVPWAEWNGRYRDSVRRVWMGHESALHEFGSRLAGSSDLYGSNRRTPGASINFITAHDGFTLHDLVTYQEKHNEQNGEQNRDGESHNNNWNCGLEGENAPEHIRTVRHKLKRNLIATLLCSQGVPMLLGGDEQSRTQQGNNNAYCQDSPVSWLDWAEGKDDEFLSFTSAMIRLRKKHPVLRRTQWLTGKANEHGERDVLWLKPDGREMTDADWHHGKLSLGMLLSGKNTGRLNDAGELEHGPSLFLCINASRSPVEMMVPIHPSQWNLLMATDSPEGFLPFPRPVHGGSRLQVSALTMCILESCEHEHVKRANASIHG